MADAQCSSYLFNDITVHDRLRLLAVVGVRSISLGWLTNRSASPQPLRLLPPSRPDEPPPPSPLSLSKSSRRVPGPAEAGFATAKHVVCRVHHGHIHIHVSLYLAVVNSNTYKRMTPNHPNLTYISVVGQCDRASSSREAHSSLAHSSHLQAAPAEGVCPNEEVASVLMASKRVSRNMRTRRELEYSVP